MNAESEAAEIMVKLIGQGTSEVLKIGGQASVGTARGVAALTMFCYALKKGGSPGEIAKNPGGMAIVTIPEESLETFRKNAKAYKLQFFSVNNKEYDKGFVDICMKTEDVATAKRVLDMMGTSAVTSTVTATNTKDAEIKQEQDALFSGNVFEKVSEDLKVRSQKFEESLNRNTDKDFSSATPYCVCCRKNPENYILIHPELSLYNNEEYTKSTYTVFRGEEKVGEFTDGRFDGKEKGYWTELKQTMKEAGNFNDDMIWFRSEDSLAAYQSLAKGEDIKPVEVNLENGDAMSRFEAEIKQKMEDLKVDNPVPEGSLKSVKGASKNGQKSGEQELPLTSQKTTKPDKNGVREFVEEYAAKKTVAPKPRGKVQELKKKR